MSMTLTSPTMAGSKVGNWYTARSFVFSAPVAHRVWEGFKAILWIPQGHSAGTLFLLLFRDGIWNCFPVLVSKMINWNFKNSVFHTASIQSLQKNRKKKMSLNDTFHRISSKYTYFVTFGSYCNLSIIHPVRWKYFVYLPQFKLFLG